MYLGTVSKYSQRVKRKTTKKIYICDLVLFIFLFFFSQNSNFEYTLSHVLRREIAYVLSCYSQQHSTFY